ncbi:hypothetical protein BOX37_16195 [Nocardia mangyaensis]|uniref:Aminoglycoside phosphotransferase domain-containing protein n=1 Tax=Nocardia mangyaensis TaxID=2213200 RepID=A0A1J0VT69_9NOCA|nr:hypothetical protein BOX37_16195 [Nocardia mangyaensis]
MIAIPEPFARETIHREGEPGRTWIAALPELIDDLLQRWSCSPEGAVRHGNVGIIVPVRHSDLPPAAIKISFPHPGNVFEPDAFATWNGRGAVHLLERDDDHFAMLLERTGRGTLADVTDFDTAVSALGELSHRLAVPAPMGLPRLSDLVSGWDDEITAEDAQLGHPLPAMFWTLPLPLCASSDRANPRLWSTEICTMPMSWPVIGNPGSRSTRRDMSATPPTTRSP